MDERHLFDWKGQKVIVTGGASGMGYETARLFGLYGAKVCIIDISDKLEETAGRLKEATGAEYQTVRANLTVRTGSGVLRKQRHVWRENWMCW